MAERPAVNRRAAGSSPAVPAFWSFVQRKGTCLIRRGRRFDSCSSDHTIPARGKLICRYSTWAGTSDPQSPDPCPNQGIGCGERKETPVQIRFLWPSVLPGHCSDGNEGSTIMMSAGGEAIFRKEKNHALRYDLQTAQT